MLFPQCLCIVRGAGDLATGALYRLHRAGFPVLALELDKPRVVRRMASFAQAMFAGEARVDELAARRMTLPEAAASVEAASPIIPVVADPNGEAIRQLRPSVVVDGRLAKSALDTTLNDAPLVIGLGPGFAIGLNCHVIIETIRGHNLGRVIWSGAAHPDTGRPESVMGYTIERILSAPATGTLRGYKNIGDAVHYGDLIASVEGEPITAPFIGVLRGLMHGGLPVTKGEKVGDLDPRREPSACFTISDKSLAIGGGVVEAVLTWMQLNDER